MASPRDAKTDLVKTELSTLTLAELRKIASALDLQGRSKMKKAQLVEALAGAPGVDRFVATSAGASLSVPPSSPPAPSKPAPSEPPADAPAVRPSRTATNTETAPAGPVGVAAEPEDTSEVVPAAESAAAQERFASPPNGGSGRLGLLLVDPTCVFVFWDVEQEMITRARDYVGDPQGAVLLRTYGVAGVSSGDEASVRGRFDLFVESAKGEQYLQLSSPGRSVSCELGVESRDGRFHAFAWSNRLDLPSERQSPSREVRRIRIGGERSTHWQARGAVRPPLFEPAVVAAEAALPTDSDENGSSRSSGPFTSDVVMASEELAALWEPREYSVGLSSEEAARRARRGLFSAALGVSSSSVQVKVKDEPATPLEGGPHGSHLPHLKIFLPGLIDPKSIAD